MLLAVLSVLMLLPILLFAAPLLAAVHPVVGVTASALFAIVSVWRSWTVCVRLDQATLHVRNRYRTTRIPLQRVRRIAERPWMGNGPSVVTVQWPGRLLPWGLALEGSLASSVDAMNESWDFARQLRARAPHGSLAGRDAQ